MSTPTAARQLTELQRLVARFSQPDLLYLKDITFRHDQRHKGVVADRAASISWTKAIAQWDDEGGKPMDRTRTESAKDATWFIPQLLFQVC